ncbi:hypothetical protein Nmel_007834 [Mimus melanotis]
MGCVTLLSSDAESVLVGPVCPRLQPLGWGGCAHCCPWEGWESAVCGIILLCGAEPACVCFQSLKTSIQTKCTCWEGWWMRAFTSFRCPVHLLRDQELASSSEGWSFLWERLRAARHSRTGGNSPVCHCCPRKLFILWGGAAQAGNTSMTVHTRQLFPAV